MRARQGRAPLPGDGLRDRRGADHLVLRRDPAPGGRAPAVANYVGMLHGILYIIYLVFAYLLTRRLRLTLAGPRRCSCCWPGTIPVLTFVVERWVTHRYIDPALAAARAARAGRHVPRDAATRLRRRSGSRPAAPGMGGGPVSQQYFAERARPRRTGRARSTSSCPTCTWSWPPTPGCSRRRRLDPGTRLLLETAPAPPAARGDLLDLGTGYGPLALVLAARAPGARVWAVDVNQRALELCAAQRRPRRAWRNVRCVAPGRPGAARGVRR